MNNMRLYLSGGGDADDSIELDKRFASTLDRSKPLLYIPIAMNTSRHPYPECLKWLKGIFNPLGIEDIVMWTEKELKRAKKEDYDRFGGVYIGGGNTFKLLKELKEFGTYDILKDVANKDIPIYGGSAGAVILARTIIPALSADPNDVKLKNFDSLNLLRDYDLFPHYEKEQDATIRRYMKEYRLKKVLAVPENGGLFLDDDDGILVVGPGSSFVFEDGKREVKPGRNINL
jgi:dipeptidase E